MQKKLIVFIQDLLQVSKLTKTKNKKIRILSIAIVSNVIVLMDIVIILSFTNIFTNEVGIENVLTNFFFENLYLLPLIIILRFLSIYFEKVNIAKLRLEVEENLRDSLTAEIFSKGNYSSSDAYFYLNTISGQVSSFYGTLATFMSSFLQVVAYSLYLIITDLELVSYMFFGLILLYVPTLLIVKEGRKVSNQTYISSQEISSKIEKIVDNIYLIKILNFTKSELANFQKELKVYYESTLKNVKLGTTNALIPNFITMLTIGVAVAFFNIVSFITLDFIGVALRLFQSLGVLNSNLHLVSAYHVYLEKLFLLEKNRSTTFKENFKVNPYLENNIAIKFEDVEFKYFNSDFEIFKNLNLVFYQGKHTMITGPHGSGKSTLLGLLSGIFYSNEGKVLTYSNKFGYIGAKPMIINATLKENLLYGNENKNKTDKELLDMVSKFKLFNEEYDNTLNKQINNKSLSTGQMQKISFIRALLNDVEILLLDEALSNVDDKAKSFILEIIEELDITIINITHNIDDYENIDKHLKIEIENEKRIVSYFK